jgi:hypothetical protein
LKGSEDSTLLLLLHKLYLCGLAFMSAHTVVRGQLQSIIRPIVSYTPRRSACVRVPGAVRRMFAHAWDRTVCVRMPGAVCVHVRP